MNEDEEKAPATEQPEEITTPVEPAQAEEPKPMPSVNAVQKGKGLEPWHWLTIIGSVLLLAVGGFLMFSKDSAEPIETNEVIDTEDATTEDTDDEQAVGETAPIDCPTGTSLFADEEVGMAFCYPSVWGATSVEDAKVGEDDTGYRESIFFDETNYFAVGGVSEDWSTTVGRGVGCLEPNNSVPELSAYNTEWHNIESDGMVVMFAQRSLPASIGGYDMTETVSDFDGGVCVHGHKVINASRYEVAFAGYFREFSELSGIMTPSAHMDSPNILFTTEQRELFDALLASIVAY